MIADAARAVETICLCIGIPSLKIGAAMAPIV